MITKVEITREMAKRLFNERTKLGLSMEEVAHAINASHANIIYRYENCIFKTIKVAALSKLAILYKVSMPYLLCVDTIDYNEKINEELSTLPQKDLINVYNLIKSYKRLKGLM